MTTMTSPVGVVRATSRSIKLEWKELVSGSVGEIVATGTGRAGGLATGLRYLNGTDVLSQF